MSFSQRELEGYVRIDHRDSPGLGLPFRGGGQLFEAPTFTCTHCQAVVVINPSRTRERARCYSCDHDICDGCGTKYKLTGVCLPYKKIQEDYIESILKGASNGT